MRMSLVPAQKKPPELKEKKPTATEKEGQREKSGCPQEGICLPGEGGRKGKAQKGQEQERDQEWAPWEECRKDIQE